MDNAISMAVRRATYAESDVWEVFVHVDKLRTACLDNLISDRVTEGAVEKQTTLTLFEFDSIDWDE